MAIFKFLITYLIFILVVSPDLAVFAWLIKVANNVKAKMITIKMSTAIQIFCLISLPAVLALVLASFRHLLKVRYAIKQLEFSQQETEFLRLAADFQQKETDFFQQRAEFIMKESAFMEREKEHAQAFIAMERVIQIQDKALADFRRNFDDDDYFRPSY